MSGFDGVVGGKLKLKGKALDVKAAGMKRKKKKTHNKDISLVTDPELSAGEGAGLAEEANDEVATDDNKIDGEEKAPSYDHLMTPAERRYIEQREMIDVKRLAKTSNKSHRDRIQDFNQYLANMSEHYDIPKVGPG